MINNEIETKLRNWFEKMVNRYKWLNIKFEYGETRGIYLISYSPVQKKSVFINCLISIFYNLNGRKLLT